MTSQSFVTQLVGLVGSVFDAYSAVLFLPDAGKGACRLAASFSLGEAVDTDVAIAPGMGLVGWIIREGKPLLINNFDQRRGVLGYYRGGEEERIRAFMGTPISAVGGALCLDSRKTYTFGDKDLKILSQFATLVGSYTLESGEAAASLVEHRYYQCLHLISGLPKAHSKWSSFRSALLSLLSQVTGFSHCILTVRDESGRSYFLEGANASPFAGFREPPERFSMGQGLVGWVFKHQTPVYSGEKDAASAAGLPLFGLDVPAGEFKSVVCLPLTFSRRTRGVLVLADGRGLAVTEELKAFLAMVSEYLALFLENLHLKIKLATPGP